MKPFSYYDMIEAFKEPGCVLCRLLNADTRRYLDLLLYEYAMDFEIHGTFRASRGLCSAHAFQLLPFQMGATSIAALYEGVIEEVLGVLDALDTGESGRRKLFGGKRPTGKETADAVQSSLPCACCASLNIKEAGYVQVVLDALDDTAFRDAYAASDGFCLPHMATLLRQAPPDATRVIISVQRRVWANLRADLNMFMAKQDPRFGVPIDEREASSWRRAVSSIAGSGGLFGLRGR